MPGELTTEALLGWVDRYERAWRTDPLGARLGELFAVDVTYLPEPYAEELAGLDDLRSWWAVGQEYVDLWVVTVDDAGLVSSFEEWPFWPEHGRSPRRPPAVVVGSADVAATPYGEWVRSAALSSGVYRLAAGAVDGQSPHAEDEVYVVTAGAADLEVDGVRSPVRAGSLAYVPRRVPHRFVDVTDDLEVAVVFAPPEAGGPAGAP